MSSHVEFPKLTPEAQAALSAAAQQATLLSPVLPRRLERRAFAAFLREAIKQAMSGNTSFLSGLYDIADNLHAPPPPPPTLAEAREADMNTPEGKALVRDFLACLATLEGGNRENS